MNYLKIIEVALRRVVQHDSCLIGENDSIVAINHRLARAMEAELHCELEGADLVVDLEWAGNSGLDPLVAPAAAIVPSVAVHSRTDALERPLAIECRRKLLSPKDKQRLLLLGLQAGGYERVFGIAWKPGQPWILFYYLRDGLVRVKRLAKQKIIIRL